MQNYDWLITDGGNCEACEIKNDWEWTEKPYRLYRFLTDVEDILNKTSDERLILQAVRPLVRRLLTSSYWLAGEYKAPDSQRGWSVLTLYDEVDFPLTVQTVVWLPGRTSTIHNHGTWGIVALLDGEEKNSLWQRVGDSNVPNRIEKVGEKRLLPGDMMSFTSQAIHCVEALGNEPTVSFNLYGVTNYDRRFEFDSITHTAKKF